MLRLCSAATARPNAIMSRTRIITITNFEAIGGRGLRSDAGVGGFGDEENEGVSAEV